MGPQVRVSPQGISPAAADEGHGFGVEHRQGKGLCDIVVTAQSVAAQGVLFSTQGRQE